MAEWNSEISRRPSWPDHRPDARAFLEREQRTAKAPPCCESVIITPTPVVNPIRAAARILDFMLSSSISNDRLANEVQTFLPRWAVQFLTRSLPRTLRTYLRVIAQVGRHFPLTGDWKTDGQFIEMLHVEDFTQGVTCLPTEGKAHADLRGHSWLRSQARQSLGCCHELHPISGEIGYGILTGAAMCPHGTPIAF